ncbi:MAG: Holliday junction branch migration protein RuvA [Burkholderiales bacterium]
MIGRLTGILLEKNPPHVLVDCGGIGYEVDVPMSTLYGLPEPGGKVTLFTQLIVREDAHLLYGFGSHSEREAFRQLTRISGVGPRTALAVLSGLSVAELAQAVALQETGRLTRVPGIGKKTAERLLLELKGKFGGDLAIISDINRAAPAGNDVLNALLALGYNDREALAAIKALPDGLSVSEGIRHALRALSKA